MYQQYNTLRIEINTYYILNAKYLTMQWYFCSKMRRIWYMIHLKFWFVLYIPFFYGVFCCLCLLNFLFKVFSRSTYLPSYFSSRIENGESGQRIEKGNEELVSVFLLLYGFTLDFVFSVLFLIFYHCSTWEAPFATLVWFSFPFFYWPVFLYSAMLSLIFFLVVYVFVVAILNSGVWCTFQEWLDN